MFGGYSRLACLEVETFLQSLADHPFFSEHHDVHTCLTADMSPHDTIGAASLWTSLTSAYFNHQLTTIQDTDEEFVETLKTVNECIPVVEACSRDFNHMATAWQRVACAEVTVCECVKEEGEWEVGRNDACAISLTSLSNVLNEHQKYNHSASTDAQNTIGFTFDLQHRYSKQAKDMLYRRLDKVQVLINASKQLDKAKPEKKEAAEVARAAAMTSYKTITDTAKAEVSQVTNQFSW
jgi:sorting nexin-5/6/32